MSEPARVMFVGLDACDPAIAKRLIDRGELPNLSRLFRAGARARFENERGFFVGAVWPTLITGVPVDRHYWYSGTIFRPADYTYGARHVGRTLWDRCSEVGQRVAVFDAPHSPVVPEINGVQVCEWGAHDRLYGTACTPPELLAALEARHGRHPIGTADLCPDPRHSPCDYVHTVGGARNRDDEGRFFADLLSGIECKTNASLDVLDREGWDLFYTVFGESHCVGHQLWHLHDSSHPRFDPLVRERLGADDPLVEVYRRVDDALGQHLARLGPDGTAYVALSHGVGARSDANHLLPQLLRRLNDAYEREVAARRGPRIGRTDLLLHLLPPGARAALVRAFAPRMRSRLAKKPVPPPLDERHPSEQLFFSIDNHSVVSAIRLNIRGREGHGLVDPDDAPAIERWLTHRLRELVNVETGAPIVQHVVRTADLYPHDDGHVLPDLLVEWEHGALVRRVWSPATGVVDLGYDGVRTGDHTPGGMLLAVGPGIRPCDVTISPLDIVPTMAAALGVPTPDLDGAAVERLLPATAPPRPARQPSSSLRRRMTAYTAAAGAMGMVDPEGLATSIVCTMHYVETITVPEHTTISVIIPTRNRPELVARAIDSVLAQSYTNVEVLVVDDASDDGGAVIAQCDDPRVRVIRFAEHRGSTAARNRGLDEAAGEIIAYLDDDNTFDQHWLKSVAWSFTVHPEHRMLFGARLIDDVGRHFGRAPDGQAGLQLHKWNRAVQRLGNLIDMNVVAHRRGPERFEEALNALGDWDLVLQLTDARDPLRVPVIASHYTTAAPGRLSDLGAHEMTRETSMIQGKWRGAPVP